MLLENLNMVFDAQQYFSEINIAELSSRNVVLCRDNESRKTLLIRNAQDSSDFVSFENAFFIMKNNVELYVDKKKLGNFHVLICKSTDDIIVGHFCRVCNHLFLKSDDKMRTDELVKLFYSLEKLFAEVEENNRALEIGIYGELAAINYLYSLGNKAYNKWHADFFNKHDFEIDKKVKVEVKTTSKNERIHSFGHDQIYRTNLKVYVISAMIKTCEKGTSIYELCKNTMDILTDRAQLLAIESLMKKLGLSENYQGVNCILEDVYKTIKIYSAENIPHLSEAIPEGVSNIHYDIDLTNIDDCSFAVLNSK